MMQEYYLCYIILAAYILDLLLGDPRWLPHPVVWMGNAVSFFETVFRKWIRQEFVSGVFFALFLIFSTWGITFGIVKILSYLHPVAGIAVQVILLFFCLSARTLEKAASEVKHALEKEGRYHKSPNAGFPEASFAGALAIKLGGPGCYHGTLMKKSYFGIRFNEPGREKIKMACDLMMLSSLVSILTIVFVFVFMNAGF